MKFKGIVIGLLAAILVVNTVMAGLLVTEAKKQTEYEEIAARAIVTIGRYDTGVNQPAEYYQNEMNRLYSKLMKSILGYDSTTPAS